MPPVKSRLLGALLSALLLALSFPLTLLPLPSWLHGTLPFDLPSDPALGSFSIPGLPTQLGYLQFPWMAFVALVPLLLAVRAARRSGEAFALGIACGIPWLILTMLWLVSFGFVPVLLLAIYFSLPVGLFTWVSWHLMHMPAAPRLKVARLVWAIPLLWTAIEYLRSFGMWAFPWNFLGYPLAAYPMLAQTADIGGVYLVSFLVVLANVLIVTLLSNAGTVGLRATHVSFASLLLVAAFGYGWWRDKHPGPDTKQRPLTFELVQGGISSRDEWDEESYRKSLEAYAGTTRDLLGLNYATAPFSSRPVFNSLPPAVKPVTAGNTVSTPGYVPAMQPVQPQVVTPKKHSVPIGDVLVVWPEGALLKRGGFDLDEGGDGVPFEVRQLVDGDPAHALLWGALGFRPAAKPAQPLAPTGVVSTAPATMVRPPEPVHPVQTSPFSPSAQSGSSRAFPKPVPSSTVAAANQRPQREANRQPKVANAKKRKRVHVMSDAEKMRERRLRLVNGCILTSREGSTWPYSKIRLVPYGEVTPFRGIVTFLHFPWDFGGVDLNAGRELKPLEWRGHKLGALICFDNIFSFIPRAEAKAGAQYLVVMTNNSWYPMRSGIRQHCDIDVFRAIETRRPLLRCSTTGWSQVVDRNGRIIKSSEQRVGSPDSVEAAMQPGSGTTPYMLVGDLFAQLCLLGALLFTVPPLVIGRSEGFL